MKLTGNTKKSMTVGSTSMVIQDINLNNTKAVISILRDKIYTDKPKAAITETLCNAIDEHRKYNVKRPVDVIITSTNLIIRDYAKGLDEAGVTKVFFQYMNSTKSDNDIDIGGYGIGAKAPSSYTSTWYVISYHGGKKTTYMSTIDGDVGKTYKMLEQDCDPNNTGICVIIPLEGEEGFGRRIEARTFLSLASDLRTMIGGFNKEEEIECYYFPESISNIKDYDDFEKATKEELAAGKGAFNDDQAVYDISLKDFFNKNEEKINSRFDYYLIPNEILILRSNCRSNSSLFSSNFFSSTKAWAYDGDICYSIKIPKDIKDKYHMDGFYSTFIFLFKRGEMAIAPTREDISMSSKVTALLDYKLQLLDVELNNKLTEKFEQFIKEKNTIFRSYKQINKLINLDFNSYKGRGYGYRVLNKYPTLHTIVGSSKAYVPKGNNSVIECKVDTYLDEHGTTIPTVGSTTVKRWSHWEGYGLPDEGEVVFLVTESNTKHKAYYKAELVKAVVAYRHSLGLPHNKVITVVLLDKKDSILGYFSSLGAGEDSQELVRKNVEWFHIDDIVGFIPKRVINRVKTVTNTTNNKQQTTKVVFDIWNTYHSYSENDLKGKKVLGILASDLTSSESYWKTFKNDIYSNGYKDWRKTFAWLSGYDYVVKIYKDDVSYWTKVGVTIAPQDIEFRKKLIEDGANKHDIILIPWCIEQLAFLDNGDYLKKHVIKNKLNLGRGSGKTIDTFSLYEVSEVINLLHPHYLRDLRAKLSEKIKEKIEVLNPKDKEVFYNALVARSLGVDSTLSCNLGSTLCDDLVSKAKTSIQEIRKKAYKEAEHVYQYLVKNIDFSLN